MTTENNQADLVEASKLGEFVGLVEVGQVETTIAIRPDLNIEVTDLVEKANAILAYAKARVITSADDVREVTDDLAVLKGIRSRLEGHRKAYLCPIDEHRKRTNDTFKLFMEPLDEAEKLYRDKVGAFNEALRQLKARQEEIERLQAEQTALTGEVFDKPEPVQEPISRAYGNIGTASTMTIWTWELESLKDVPLDYVMVDSAKVTKVVKAAKGQITIPGIRVFPKETLQVRTKGE